MTRRWIGVLATVAVAGVAATAWLVLAGDGGGDSDTADGSDLSSASVQRRDLVERETFDGSLGFADEQALASARAGTITWIADEGSTIRRGDPLYAVDERPVSLMFGEVPAYRSLSSGIEGRDVRQLQRNLLALGFDDGGDLEVNGEFDADTAEAVRDWQEDLGLDRTGVVELGDVVFASGPRRMGQHVLEEGSSAAGQVATITSLERTVTIALDASDQDLVSEGDRVQVELPGGERISGRIGEVGKVAESDPRDAEAEPTVEVTVRLVGRVKTDLDQAPVDVDVQTSREDGVLAVPVEALLAIAEGGYGVEVVDAPGRTHLVGVDTGTFADGWVEVSGTDVSEGLEVVTAS
jgi:peptidoglycan hydrolase-like protein with peptidoglycan-binding domain